MKTAISRAIKLIREPRAVAVTVFLGLLYSALWIITAFFGARDAVEAVDRYTASEAEYFRISSEDLSRTELMHLNARTPWRFIGNATSLMPFVFTVEYASRVDRAQGSGISYQVIWLFGYTWVVGHALAWMQ